MVGRASGLVALSLVLAVSTMAAQDVAPQFSGRLDSSWNRSEEGGQSIGLVTGWAGLTAGTPDVKTEVRLGLTNLPQPAVELQRAWTKFRFPGMRFTTGLGRLAWGPGLVLVPGDLLFDATASTLDWGADEVRTGSAWLGDAWFSLGEEAFAEVGALRDTVGARVSAAPGGVTLEAASAWDQTRRVGKAALSTQFHWGVDWYATARQDVPSSGALSLENTSGGAGAFALWDLGGPSLTSRHEIWAADPGPRVLLKSYHDLFWATEGWSVGGRAQYDQATRDWTPSVEIRWMPLQNLGLYTTATLEHPRAFRVGALARW